MTMEEQKRMHTLEDLLKQVLYWYNHDELDCNNDKLRCDLIDLMADIEKEVN